MKTIRRTSQFKKDVKRMGKRGNKFEVFKEVIRKLVAGESLDSKYRDHLLVGQYRGLVNVILSQIGYSSTR